MANRVGRPLKFTSVEQVIEKAEAYFAVTPPRQQTITGLALALDTSRSTLMIYEGTDEFSNTIKKYKDQIEHAYELSLRDRGGSGDIFGLKNFGWTDRAEVDLTTAGEKIESKPMDMDMVTQFMMMAKDQTKQ